MKTNEMVIQEVTTNVKAHRHDFLMESISDLVNGFPTTVLASFMWDVLFNLTNPDQAKCLTKANIGNLATNGVELINLISELRSNYEEYKKADHE